MDNESVFSTHGSEKMVTVLIVRNLSARNINAVNMLVEISEGVLSVCKRHVAQQDFGRRFLVIITVRGLQE